MLSIKVWLKLLYYEMASLILLSIAFWVVSAPVVTFGAAVLAMFDIVRGIYDGDEPRGERRRLRRFFSSVKVHLADGLILSLLITFVVINTAWYFSIALSGANIRFIVGGLLGLYALFLLAVFICRTVNFHVVRNVDWWTSLRSAASTWAAQPTLTVLQVTIVTIAVLVTVLIPLALVLIIPAAITLFEFVYYDELAGNNPQVVLTRYVRQNDF